jgi:transposase
MASGVRELIETADATLLYPPPYSPDLNPIEQAFSKLKPPPPQGSTAD